MNALIRPELSGPLMIGVIPSGVVSRGDGSEAEAKAAAEFEALRPQILERDKHTCQFCGYMPPTKKYMEVHHLNGDHLVNTPDNLITACHYCHMSHHLGYARICGAVIGMIDLSQEELSRINRYMVNTLLTLHRPHIIQSWNNLIRESVSRAKAFLTDAGYNGLPQMLRGLTTNPEAYREQQRYLYDQKIRLLFPPLEYNIARTSKRNSEPFPISVSADDRVRAINTEAWLERMRVHSHEDCQSYIKALKSLK